MIFLSDREAERQRESQRIRGPAAQCGYMGDAGRVAETYDLPFFFQIYKYEAPLRKWLTTLYVTGFAHGRELQVALKDACTAAWDANSTDYVIEACYLRGWLNPCGDKPTRDLEPYLHHQNRKYGADAVAWSKWGFEPAGNLQDWLEGGPLPAIGCELKKADYLGRLRGLHFREQEKKAYARDIDHDLEAVYEYLQSLPADDTKGMIWKGEYWLVPWVVALAELRARPRWRDVTEEVAVASIRRILKKGDLVEVGEPPPKSKPRARGKNKKKSVQGESQC